MNINNIFIIMLLVGVGIISYSIGLNNKPCPTNTVYRYLPRDFNIDKHLPDGISYKFKDLFEKPTPFVFPIGNNNKRILH